ncbi:hypothetical protein MPH_10548 [Macrophomina phaseolina MS6]|uniref:Secreted protein n=1 Tax=Macrophomina phaseolina (strain MS6) TaxID=1126212 RepID=K2QRA7_MACPH|nr:hypothetical protein MPH_10548 [Macrophomina phaseolina MS6]
MEPGVLGTLVSLHCCGWLVVLLVQEESSCSVWKMGLCFEGVYRREIPLEEASTVCPGPKLATGTPHDRWIDLVVRVLGSIFNSCTTPENPYYLHSFPHFSCSFISQHVPEKMVFLIC